MIEVRTFAPDEIKRAYNARGWVYSKIVAPREHQNHLVAIERANIRKGEKLLEVAVGPGMTLVELAKKTGKHTTVYGVDISTRMLQLARERMHKEGYTNFDLREADCRNLPFEDGAFDILYNGYMLDLIPLNELSPTLNEFDRVLKPGGRLVLLNKSKKDVRKTFQEKLYERLPANFVLYVFGLCRPVLMEKLVRDAGFEKVNRSFLEGVVASEIVIARKRSN